MGSVEWRIRNASNDYNKGFRTKKMALRIAAYVARRDRRDIFVYRVNHRNPGDRLVAEFKTETV